MTERDIFGKRPSLIQIITSRVINGHGFDGRIVLYSLLKLAENYTKKDDELIK